MSGTLHDEGRLHAELADLRTALRTVQAPEPDETALRAEFREAQRQRVPHAAAASAPGSWRLLRLAAAAVVVLAVTAVIAAMLLRVERPVPVSSAANAPAPPLTVTAFQPLLNSPGFVPSASYSVVRVRIPRSSFALVPGTEQGGTIEAELLVGEDGLARGIRFNQADALLVSAAEK
jgi:hypothetical protein